MNIIEENQLRRPGYLLQMDYLVKLDGKQEKGWPRTKKKDFLKRELGWNKSREGASVQKLIK